MLLQRYVQRVVYTLLLLAGLLSASPLHAHGFMEGDVPQATDFPPIEEDIERLKQYGAQAKQAAARLIMQGEAVIEPANRALVDPQATYPQKLQLITLLGDIGDPSSVEPILQVASASIDPYLQQNTLLALTKFESSADIRGYVDQQLAKDQQVPLITRSALAYYSQQPHPDATRWVDEYARSTVSEDIRYAALYLGGMLGMQTYKQDIVEMLYAGVANGTRQYYLLQGLVELTEPDEFHRLTQDLDFVGNNRRKIEAYIRLRKSDNSQRTEQAEFLLARGDISQKLAAVKFLIAQKNATALAAGWKARDPFVHASLKRAGYEIEIHNGNAQLLQVHRPHGPNWTILSIILASILGVIAYVWRKSR